MNDTAHDIMCRPSLGAPGEPKGAWRSTAPAQPGSARISAALPHPTAPPAVSSQSPDAPGPRRPVVTLSCNFLPAQTPSSYQYPPKTPKGRPQVNPL